MLHTVCLSINQTFILIKLDLLWAKTGIHIKIFIHINTLKIVGRNVNTQTHLVFKPLNLLFKPPECGSTVAMRTSAAEVNQSQNSSSSGQCFSNPSYHTVAQCNVVSTISSNLDGTLTLKVWPLSMSIHIQFNFPITSYCINATPNCALPFSVKHLEKQKWLRMESLLQPQ